MRATAISWEARQRDRRSTTSRRGSVLTLMAQGRSNHGIAELLVVTTAAIERHVTSIFSKLDLRQAPEDHRRLLAVLEFLKRS